MSRFFTIPLLAIALVAVGCGGGSDSSSSSTGTAPDTTPTKAPTSGKKLVVGFSQIGAESAWRTANTQSIKDEAEKRGIELKFSDAQGKQENQIKAIRAFIQQQVDVIAFAPVVETGWKNVLQEAKDAGIPVFVSDRRPDVPEDMYVTFIGSDFIKEGQMAGDWLAKATGGKAVIAELTGTPGSAPANDRAKGFRDAISKYPDMKIVVTQTGDFKRAQGLEVMEALLKSPDGAKITALYAHNDDMAIGAISAIEAAGKKPGTDIKIVSIDGIHDAFQAMIDGKENHVVECNPLLGPYLFDSIEKFKKGETLPKRQIIHDDEFDSSQAAAALPNRKY